jgi:hypothetical protein
MDAGSKGRMGARRGLFGKDDAGNRTFICEPGGDGNLLAAWGGGEWDAPRRAGMVPLRTPDGTVHAIAKVIVTASPADSGVDPTRVGTGSG